MENLGDVLMKFRGINPLSATRYVTNLQNLYKKISSDDDVPNNFEWLKRIDPIIVALEGYSDSTQRNYLNAVIVAYRANFANDEILSQYEEMRDKLNDSYMESTTGKTVKQQENWITLEEFDDIIKDYREKSRESREKPFNLSKSEKQSFQDYLLLSLYRQLPVRNDFADMKVINKREYNRLNSAEKQISNFLVTKDKKPLFFSMNEYKTSQKYQEKKLDVPEDLKKDIKKWLKLNQTGFFLINVRTDKPMSPNSLTKTLNRLFFKKFKKKISTTMLRRIYLTQKYGQIKNDMKADADMMGHSEEAQNIYIKA